MIRLRQNPGAGFRWVEFRCSCAGYVRVGLPVLASVLGQLERLFRLAHRGCQ